MEEKFLVFTIIRFIVGFLVLPFPILGTIVSAYIDGYDWHLLKLSQEDEYEFYRVWDKVMDSYYLAIALVVALRWKDKIARRLAVVSYVWRSIGIILFIFLNKSIFLLLFPNFFENLFIFYFLFTKLTKESRLFLGKLDVIVVSLSLLIPKLIVEYTLHILKVSPFGIYGFYFIYLGPPLLCLAWLIAKRRSFGVLTFS